MEIKKGQKIEIIDIDPDWIWGMCGHPAINQTGIFQYFAELSQQKEQVGVIEFPRDMKCSDGTKYLGPNEPLWLCVKPKFFKITGKEIK